MSSYDMKQVILCKEEEGKGGEKRKRKENYISGVPIV
jgi:hypothetical protein